MLSRSPQVRVSLVSVRSVWRMDRDLHPPNLDVGVFKLEEHIRVTDVRDGPERIARARQVFTRLQVLHADKLQGRSSRKFVGPVIGHGTLKSSGGRAADIAVEPCGDSWHGVAPRGLVFGKIADVVVGNICEELCGRNLQRVEDPLQRGE